MCAGIIFGSVHLYNFTTGIYEEVPEETIKSFQKAILEEYSFSRWSIGYENSYYIAFCRALTSYREIDGSPNSLVFSNGTLNVNSKKLHKHTPKVIKLTGIPYDYDVTATAPNFLAAVDDIFNGHKPTIDNLQELFGYVLYCKPCKSSHPKSRQIRQHKITAESAKSLAIQPYYFYNTHH